jgi:exosortase A-associated hydrolase 1
MSEFDSSAREREVTSGDVSRGYGERAVSFRCAGEDLVGVVASPDAAKPIGVVIVVGGAQYRAGSHRQFILLARALATAGYPALRFDHRGAGDATGAMRVFTDLDDDIAAAIDELCRACALERVVLFGLCDAASAALMYSDARRDPRIAGFVLLNPWVRSEATLARVQVKHYYRERVLDPAFWRKLARGDVDVRGAVRSFAGALSATVGAAPRAPTPDARSFQQRMADGLDRFAGPVLLLLSGRDLTAREFVEHASSDLQWSALLARTTLDRRELPDADHTCSSARGRGDVERLAVEWLERVFADSRR